VSADWAKARAVAEIDWANWQPVDRATLVFVIRDGEILLIDKKRGLGKGKVNGPGGKVDPGETVKQCAIRECEEELGIKVSALQALGEHRFQFTNGYSIHCWVYRSDQCLGQATETPEAAPRWTPLGEIPYELMWEDDRIWLPLLIDGQAFQADWIFDEDTMLDHRLNRLERLPEPMAGR
jgi:8-oxo-dGTP diphosphatase